METLRPASDGPPGRALRRALTVLGIAVVLGLLAVAVATANPGVVADFNQCANDTGAGPCTWINGDLNANNSNYTEGDAVPERVVYNTTCGTNETLTIRYQTTNKGKHAYDYLTNYNFSETYLNASNICAGTSVNCAVPSTGAMQPDPNVAGTTHPELPSTGRVFSMFSPYGGTISAGIPTIFSGSYTGDSLTDVLLTFNASCNGLPPGSTVPVLIAFGAHVAREADWGVGEAAFNINGSPYHVMTINGGSRDNQMQANAIVPGLPELKICKQVLGVDPADPNHVFHFTYHQPGGPAEPFTLVRDQCVSLTGANFLNHNIDVLELLGTSNYIFRRVVCVQLAGTDSTFTPISTGTGVGIQVRMPTDTDRVQCTFVNAFATAVKLASFNGRAAGGKVQLDWQTGTETNNAGFNVLRATSAAGPYVKVNKQLIGATGDAVAGASYSFKDKPEKYGKFFYKLEDVDMSGKATAHGPVDVTVAWPFVRPSFQPAAPGQ